MAILGRIGQLSMESGLGCKSQLAAELIKIAVTRGARESEGIKLWVCESNTVETLAWAMIANAMAVIIIFMCVRKSLHRVQRVYLHRPKLKRKLILV